MPNLWVFAQEPRPIRALELGGRVTGDEAFWSTRNTIGGYEIIKHLPVHLAKNGLRTAVEENTTDGGYRLPDGLSDKIRLLVETLLR